MKALDPVEEFDRGPAPTGFVYFMISSDPEGGDDAPTYIKIGYAKEVEVRRHNLQTALPFDLHVEAAFPANEVDEKVVHRRLAPHRIKREWFRFNDEVGDYLDDLMDAAFLFRAANGPEYEPTLHECIAAAPRARADFAEWFSSVPAEAIDAIAEPSP